MISTLLTTIRKELTAALANLALSCPEKDAEGNTTARAPLVYIGDFPAKRERGQEGREFPCVVLSPLAGYAKDGRELCDIIFQLCVYNNEQGDAEGLEMELALLQSDISRFLTRAMFDALDERFQVVPDEQGRTYRWQRHGDLEIPRPFIQMAVISRWSVPGCAIRASSEYHTFWPVAKTAKEHP